MINCANHRMIMVSSEIIWKSRHQYGDPVAQLVTWKCLCCGLTNQIEFKEEKPRE
jgi:hypothetical protein